MYVNAKHALASTPPAIISSCSTPSASPYTCTFRVGMGVFTVDTKWHGQRLNGSLWVEGNHFMVLYAPISPVTHITGGSDLCVCYRTNHITAISQKLTMRLTMLPLLSSYKFFLPEGVAILISLEIHSSMFGLTFR